MVRSSLLPLVALAGVGRCFVPCLRQLQIRAVSLSVGIAALPDVTAAEDAGGAVPFAYVGVAVAFAFALGFVGWVFSIEPAKSKDGAFKAVSLATRDDFLPPDQRRTVESQRAELEARLAERERKRQEILGGQEEIENKFLLYYKQEARQEMEDEMIQEMLNAQQAEQKGSPESPSPSRDTQKA
mmetsp:Transcript_89042/g.157724  ORF Transcript_89042/g.157724 Transcript_89042/m.157724 type:complete len:184 (-) Transcript_89042:52-603(-)